MTVVLGWALLGGALLSARLRQRRVAAAAGESAAPAKRDLSSWGGIALQGVGFACVWSGAGRALFWPGLSESMQAVLAFCAMALALSSAAFAVLAIRELGKQWSLTARVLDHHELVRSGPFARVRHPIYAALFGLLLATGIAMSTATLTVAGALFYLIGTHWRALREEKLLHATFGTDFEDYARRVPRLFPRPW